MCPSPFATEISMADDERAESASGADTEELQDGPSIEQLLTDGKRHMVCDDYTLAVSCFAEGCELLAGTYGDQATELAEPLYYYGKALLELGRAETGVLGDKVPGDKEGDVSDSDSDFQADIQEAPKDVKQPENDKPAIDGSPDADGNSIAAGDKHNTNSESTDSKLTASGATNSNEDSAGTSGDGSKDEDNGDDIDEEDDGDLSTLQLAWETLEVSRSIYVKLCEENPECQARLADVYMALSMLEIEGERFDQALADCLECLRLQKECLPEHDRSIAETHYQLAMVYQLTDDRQKELEQLNISKQVLGMKLAKLEISIKNEEDNADPQVVKEIDELKLLIPDIESRISDTTLEMKDTALYKQQIKAQLSQAASTQIGFSSSASTSKAPAAPIDTRKVNDISSLVKKRKSDQSASENPEKKAKPSDE